MEGEVRATSSLLYIFTSEWDNDNILFGVGIADSLKHIKQLKRGGMNIIFYNRYYEQNRVHVILTQLLSSEDEDTRLTVNGINVNIVPNTDEASESIILYITNKIGYIYTNIIGI